MVSWTDDEQEGAPAGGAPPAYADASGFFDLDADGRLQWALDLVARINAVRAARPAPPVPDGDGPDVDGA